MWSPYRVGLTEKIEKVQKRTTKLVQSFKGLAYSERLRVLGIPTLKYRRHRGDMIETYKIMHGIYDTAVSPVLPICQDSVKERQIVAGYMPAWQLRMLQQ